jgi:hypothetical protein
MIVFLISGCANTQKEISIVPLDMLNREDTLKDGGKILFYKAKYYLVQNYIDDKKTQQYIDKFVQRNKDPNLQKFTQYNMVFYKESKSTSLKKILENRQYADKYVHLNDRIYNYWWSSNGNFFTKYKMKNGEIIEPKNIDVEVTPLPDTSRIKKQ